MADTIIKKDLLQAEIERHLDKKPSLLNWVNMKYSPAIKRQGDTATVQTFPEITLSSGTAGAAISDQDFTITGTNITADQVKQARMTVTDFDESVSNLDLHAQLANRIAYEVQDDMEVYFASLHTNAVTANELDDGDLATATNGGAGNGAILTSSNVYEALAALKKVLRAQNAGDNAAVFINPTIEKLLIQAGFANGTDRGHSQGTKGMIAEVAGFQVFVTNNLPTVSSNPFLIAMDRDAIHGVAKYAQVDVRKGPDGFYDNVIVESIYGGSVLPNGTKRIATFELDSTQA